MIHDTTDHPKFHALKRRLGISRCMATGLLENVWHMAQKYRPGDGDLTGFSALDIAAYAEYDGEPETMLAALIETRWLDATEDGRLMVHDWQDHKPRFIKERERIQEKRAQQLPTVANRCQQLPTVANICNLLPPTQPNPTQPNPINHLTTYTQEIADGDSCAGVESGKKEKPKVDPLDKPDLAEIRDAFEELETLRSETHNRPPTPKPQTAEWFKWRTELARLATLDKYPPADVVAVLRWLYDGGYCPSHGFDWREQVQSFATLRKKCSNGITKFDNIHKRWKDSGGGEPEHDEDTKRLIEQARRFAERRDAAERQAANAAN